MPARAYALVAAGALGIWLGLQAMRAAILEIVWNVAEDAPTTQVGLVAAGVWLAGILGIVPARLFRDRAAWGFGLLFAVLVGLRQTLTGEAPTAVFALAAWIVWLWWLPAFLDALARRGALALAPAAILLGVAAQVATQATLQGSDLHTIGGAVGAIGGVALAAAFALALRAGLAARGDASGNAAWGALALGPYLFLQATLLANLGRIQLHSASEVPAASLVAAVGVAGALLALRRTTSRVVRIVASLAIAALLFAVPLAPGAPAALALVLAQTGLGVLLAGAFAAPGATSLGRTYLGAAGGAVLLLAMNFLFYSGDPLFALWPIAALVVGAASVAARASEARPEARPVLAAVALGAVAVLASAFQPASVIDGGARSKELRVLDYNIHQGIDRYGVPSVAGIAEVIERAQADLVALQEVNRGWDIAGGVDNFAWLRRRFPAYEAVYGPMHADHFGNAILSSYPIKEWGWARYALGPSRLARGYLWAIVTTPAGEVLFVSTHLTPYDRGGERAERAAQARELLAFWNGRPRAILAGDFNDGPASDAVRALVGGGLRDVLAAHGLGDTRTYISTGTPFARGGENKLDYVFTSTDLSSSDARILETAASDHLPLVVTVLLR